MKKRLLKLALSGVLIAMSVAIGIICKNFLTFGIYYRITFENLPVILAGIILGPVYGAAVGALSDVVSCISSVNPVVNPVITVGAAAVGLVAGLIPKLIVRKRSLLQYALSAYSAHLIGQVALKSVGKMLYYGMPLYGAFIGLGISVAVAAVETFIVFSIMKLLPVKKLDKSVNSKSYSECCRYLDKLRKRGSRMSLDGMTAAMRELGDPQDKIKVIHVAGTNGKGSVSKMLAAALTAAGYRTGLYITPYLAQRVDSLYLSGNAIKRDEFSDLCGRLIRTSEKFKLTEYEFLTAAAYLWFYESGVDVAVVECCMGGTDDATNIVKKPLLSCITGVSRDHMKILGDTVYEIARNKAGIIKPGCPAVVGVCGDEVKKAVDQRAAEVGSTVYYVDDGSIERESMTEDGITLSYKDHRSVKLSLTGDHQFRNAACALEACDILSKCGFDTDDKAVKAAFGDLKFEARFEKLASDPSFVFDGAHNEEGVQSFVRTYKSLYGDEACVIITGVMRDKEYEKMAEALSGIALEVKTVSPDNPRALSAEKLAEAYRSLGVNAEAYDNVFDAASAATESAKKSGKKVFAVGSLYMYNEIKRSVERLLLK